MAAIKDKMLKDINTNGFIIGETYTILDTDFYPENESWNRKGKHLYVVVEEIHNDSARVSYKPDTYRGSSFIDTYTVKLSALKHNEDAIGVNPLPEFSWHADMRECGFTIDFIFTNKGKTDTFRGKEIHGFNFNPYLTDKDGNKVYYQRDLCWTLHDKQNFIDSIYNELNCGNIVIRYNSDEKMMETLAEYDVVDGKQRLTTLISFFNDEFPDSNGYYWSDFSRIAQRRFLSKKCMTFYEFRENATDAQIKRAFLNVNFTGVPMSREHIDYVKSLNI